ncbi:MAG: phosphoenolpyruvate carboxykinase (GTP) [Gammaproteobacteria bacterium]|nr:phosphoenolpyruvate carboxykinase (GTP) [Gammaproteobacteria bacterium]OUT96191.1 MAG: phosphoenolpyruvate carboxykinase (GTP) [Gammaproteobacteria bacterium TMED36]|tara:strand:- start:1918 stop:3666 length:1749 start_codon:yes stop_codon:yes gene_type:complete
MSTSNTELQSWVKEVSEMTKPDNIYWCNGSKEEYEEFIQQMLGTGDLMKLNEETFPNCYLHRSDPSDVARVEHLTFICTEDSEDAGPNNNWMDPKEAHEKLDDLFENCMEGRTMYVIPYCMGPIGSELSRCGVEITDSPYVVANMYLMTRMGDEALSRIEKEGGFVKGIHSTGDLDPDKRFIMHFPDEKVIRSIGSGYGGNALLGKKCHALRIASYQALEEKWLAEHMLIVEIENPQGEIFNIAAAFPSACGKTNLAMLIPPDEYKGWKVRTIGDDIAWLHMDEAGQIWAINPEAGYFGVVPGTNEDDNENAYKAIQSNAIFTNVGLTDNNEPWWEGKKDGNPVIDWRGDKIERSEDAVFAHPNSRFTVSAKNNPKYSDLADSSKGVPISAIVFGGRRSELAPLVYESKDWNHGVLVGASVGSETTAAAIGEVGIIRRDPMAMKPFCGYNFADYWTHWLSFSERSENLPKIFHVNWFRKNENGFIWPGFGDNLRVLEWIIKRCNNEIDAQETPIGFLPKTEDINTSGLTITDDAMEELVLVDNQKWLDEMAGIREYFEEYEERLPEKLLEEHAKVIEALNAG